MYPNWPQPPYPLYLAPTTLIHPKHPNWPVPPNGRPHPSGWSIAINTPPTMVGPMYHNWPQPPYPLYLALITLLGPNHHTFPKPPYVAQTSKWLVGGRPIGVAHCHNYPTHHAWSHVPQLAPTTLPFVLGPNHHTWPQPPYLAPNHPMWPQPYHLPNQTWSQPPYLAPTSKWLVGGRPIGVAHCHKYPTHHAWSHVPQLAPTTLPFVLGPNHHTWPQAPYWAPTTLCGPNLGWLVWVNPHRVWAIALTTPPTMLGPMYPNWPQPPYPLYLAPTNLHLAPNHPQHLG